MYNKNKSYCLTFTHKYTQEELGVYCTDNIPLIPRVGELVTFENMEDVFKVVEVINHYYDDSTDDYIYHIEVIVK